MQLSPLREVKQKERVGPGLILAGLTVFALAALLVAGDVKYYELRQENAALEERLLHREAERTGLEQETRNLYERAKALGLDTPAEEQTVILHLRGN